MRSRAIAVAAFIAGLSLSVACPRASASIITRWDFNSSSPDGNTSTGVNTPVLGSGTLAFVGGVIPGFQSGSGADPAGSDNSSVSTNNYPAQGNGSKTAGFEFAVSTAGFSDIVVSYDQLNSTKASKYWVFQYSTDGTTFSDLAAPYAVATVGTFTGNVTTYRFSLSAIPAVNNNPNFKFRVVSAFDPAGGSNYAPTSSTTTYNGVTGSTQIDYVTVESSPTPEPAVLGLIGFAGALLLHRRRRR